MIYAAKHILLQPTQLTKLLFFGEQLGHVLQQLNLLN
jgi:hypothetical protein